MDDVLESFDRADRETRALGERTGLACPPLCGACCVSPDIETTAAELAPMAAALVRAGRAESLLAELARRTNRTCALYLPYADDPSRGRCAQYADRPLVCRLFGFAARRDRQGAPQLLACRTMRATDPERVADAERDVREGGAVAFFGGYATGGPLLPINEALRQALERALLAARLAVLEREADGSPDPEAPRPRPVRPRRAA